MHKNTLKGKTSARWWWEPRFSKLLLFIFIIVPGRNSLAQINPPVFDYVTVHPDNGNVTVVWKPSPSAEVTGYFIQEEWTPGQSKRVETVNITPGSPVPSQYSHTFFYPDVLSRPVSFNISAFDAKGEESIRTKPSHITMFNTAEYDTCKRSITVHWTPYTGWDNKLTGYSIFQINNVLIITEAGNTTSDINKFTIPDVEENKEYCFYISAKRNDGVTSFSNKVCINTAAPLPPAYITGDYTRASGSSGLDLHFSIDPATVSDSYRLYRSEASADNYTLVAEMNKSAGGSISYSDVLPASGVYNYKLFYLNHCKAEGVSSRPINNILLKGRSQAMVNHLGWNSFSSWAEGTKEVNVYRNSSLGDHELLATLSDNVTEYSDRISPESQMAGDVCYQVEAVSNPGQFGKTNISISNIFCVNMLGEVFVPNAFTPNDDGLNDIFKPSFSILPGKYSFIIYNRYGSKIFETNDISKGWDGKLPDGSKALEGAYIYYLKMESSSGQVFEKHGNFTVIYP